MSYPILVERLTGDLALSIICECCHAEEIIDVDDLLNEGLYDCPDDCGGAAVMKYEEADKCPGCGTLGFYDAKVLAGRCSRVCMLQAEYAASLKGASAA